MSRSAEGLAKMITVSMNDRYRRSRPRRIYIRKENRDHAAADTKLGTPDLPAC